MKKLNKYNFISGGYIFDLLDRAALQAVNDKFGNGNKLVFTRNAEIDYRKQLCDLRGVKTIVDFVEFDSARRVYCVGVRVRQVATDIAYGTFYFKMAYKNYCEVGGGK